MCGCGVEAAADPDAAADSGPVLPPARAAFVEVAAGYEHSCARDDDGAVWCWGRNLRGQLGDGTRIDRPRPVRAVGIDDAIGVVAGEDLTCALRADRSAWCWGNADWYAPPEDGGESDLLVPSRAAWEDVAESLRFVGVPLAELCRGADAAWRCAFPEVDDETECRVDGELVSCRASCPPTGCPSEDPRASIDGTEGATAVAGRHECGCAVVPGGVRCWGEVPGASGRDLDPRAAIVIEDGAGAVDVAISDYCGHACAAYADGHVGCWGFDTYGQVGLGHERVVVTPERVLGVRDAVDLVAGSHHTCARARDGTARCWGANGGFQIGGDRLGGYVAAPISLWYEPVLHVAAGDAGTCIVQEAGELWCTGTTAWDAVTRPTESERFPRVFRIIPLGDPVSFTAMAPWSPRPAWDDHDACAVLESGAVLCAATAIGEPVEGLPYVARVPALDGADRIVLDGGADAWGRVGGRWRSGRDGAELEGVDDLAVYAREPRCAIVAGEVRCAPYWPPLREDDVEVVAGVEEAVRLRRSHAWACALRADGAVLCWGYSGDGTLGERGLSRRGEAVRVEGLPPAADVALGTRHGCALATDGQVWCWGWQGALGVGAQLQITAARPIAEP